MKSETDMGSRKVCIIYTGGTIGMVRTDNGFAPAPGELARQMADMKDLHSCGMPEWDLIEFDPLLDSSNIDYMNWNAMAEAIESRYEDYDGFVVLHGTDTMAYSASALAFMLEGLDKPVVFTGSQIPLTEIRSDGRDNLITSVIIAADRIVPEVTMYFGTKLLRGCCSIKYSADRLVAFRSPGVAPLARAGIDIEYHYRPRKEETADAGGTNGLLVRKYKDSRIGIIKLFPGIKFSLFMPLLEAKPDGIILETFGAGNVPGYDPDLFRFIRKASENGAVVVACTQCPQGAVRLGTYEAGSGLAGAGALSGYDMTTEAAVTKLKYLLSLGLERDEVCRLMETDLRGEL